MKAFLILEDGTVFEGTHIGAVREVISEIVFNTSMAGYLEVLTDPSYAGQAVCMTYPLIGNYGVCLEDMESVQAWPDGFIVRELSRIPSNFRKDITIQEFLEQQNIPGIAGIDTRALTKILREKGTMNGMITTDEAYDLNTVLPRLKEYTTGKVVEKVTCKEKYVIKGSRDLAENGAISGSARFDKEAYEAGEREMRPSIVKELNGIGKKVALLDLGAKKNIAHSLAQRGCDVTVYPALTSAEEILNDHPAYYTDIERKAQAMAHAMRDSAEKHGVNLTVNQCGALLCPYFTNGPVRTFADTKKSDLEQFKKYFNGMLERGMYIAPSQFEATFINVSHRDEDIAALCKAADEVLAAL